MSLIRDWGHAHNIPIAALVDLERRLGIAAGPIERGVHLPHMHALGSEARQQALVRIEAAKHDIHAFRNNNGALKDSNGRLVRFGLANDSADLNAVLKSSDLIGWRKKLVTPQMVDSYVAIFWGREMKYEGWTFTGDKHEIGQLNWINLVNSCGGDAAFCTGPGSIHYVSD